MRKERESPEKGARQKWLGQSSFPYLRPLAVTGALGEAAQGKIHAGKDRSKRNA